MYKYVYRNVVIVTVNKKGKVSNYNWKQSFLPSYFLIKQKLITTTIVFHPFQAYSETFTVPPHICNIHLLAVFHMGTLQPICTVHASARVPEGRRGWTMEWTPLGAVPEGWRSPGPLCQESDTLQHSFKIENENVLCVHI